MYRAVDSRMLPLKACTQCRYTTNHRWQSSPTDSNNVDGSDSTTEHCGYAWAEISVLFSVGHTSIACLRRTTQRRPNRQEGKQGPPSCVLITMTHQGFRVETPYLPVKVWSTTRRQNEASTPLHTCSAYPPKRLPLLFAEHGIILTRKTTPEHQAQTQTASIA